MGTGWTVLELIIETKYVKSVYIRFQVKSLGVSMISLGFEDESKETPFEIFISPGI